MSVQTELLSAHALVEDAVVHCKRGEIPTALHLLSRALITDPSHEQAWLWLSGLVASDAERRFCLKRVLQANPQHPAARQGLRLLPESDGSQPPRCNAAPNMCVFPGCDSSPRASSPYCFGHWMTIFRPVTAPKPEPAAEPAPQTTPNSLSASALAERLGISSQTLLDACADLGWIERGERGWLVAQGGRQLGLIQQHHEQTGVPFIHWPLQVLDHPALPRQLRQRKSMPLQRLVRGELALREQAPAIIRTHDGHLVRCQAECAIDNWLFAAEFAHAYERTLPSEETHYCDFYLPAGRIYIDYIGSERVESLRQQARQKAAIYGRLGLNAIQLDDYHMASLDTCLRALLAQFGVRP